MTVAVYDWIAHHATARGGRLAMVDLHTGRRFTYADFDTRVARLAGALRATTGVAKGERIAVLANNSSDLFELQFACARLGAIFTPLNWRLTLPELTYIVGDAEPLALFHDPEFADTARDLAVSCGIRHLFSRAPEANAHERLIAAGPALTANEPLTHDDPATILYTSGTTGRPKGAVITHGARFWQTVNLTGPMRAGADSVCLTTLPLFHVGGLDVYANPVFHYGGVVLVMRAFDPAEALRLLCDPATDVSLFIGAPAHFLFMAQQPGFETAVFNPRLLACIAAAPVPIPQLRQWEARGLPLQQAYGMTETCGVVMALDPEDRVRKAGSAGKASLHVALRLVRADGAPAGVNEMGELWVKGPSVTPGYWRNPEGNAASFEEGWLRTGDAAMIDDEGYYYIVDRWKDMYISGGENVYPAEVEDHLFKLDALAEVAVIGIADERWGEVGRVIAVVKPGHSLTEADIMRHCDGFLARYKQPRSVLFIDALPRNATGKVHKPTLRERYGAP
jgi:fatty-acyl-CoA synthase